MALIEAIEDVKQAILDGDEVNFEAIASDHGLRAVFLKNRAEAVIGDFAKFAETHAGVAEATKAMAEENRRQRLRKRLDDKIRGHNNRWPHAQLSEDELRDTIRAANALGSRWTLVEKRVRAPRRELDIDSLIERLMKSLAS